MKIKLLDIDRNVKKEFNFSVSNLEGIDLDGELHISGTVHKLSDEYLVEGKYSAKVKTQCVRCLDDIVVDLGEKEFQARFLTSEDYKKYLETLAKAAVMTEDDYFEAVNGEIDILELVKEEMILEIPQYPACIPECKDDSYIQKYSNDGIDSRWSQLLNIKIKN